LTSWSNIYSFEHLSKWFYIEWKNYMLNNKEILYRLEDESKILHCINLSFQHVTVCYIGIITPPIILAAALGFAEYIAYLISLLLMLSGVTTFIQVKTSGPIGCGLITIQDTSITFFNALLVVGFMLLLSVFAAVRAFILLMPKAMLGGATLVMFATIAVAGVKILTTILIDRPIKQIIATLIGLGLGVMMVPEPLTQLTPLAGNIPFPSVTVVGFCAIIISLLIPDGSSELSTTHSISKRYLQC
jgi:xanthine/uracil permease